MPIEPKDVAKWSREQWKSRVKMVRPSGGGKQGVLFVFTENSPAWSIPKAAFVVKPLEGSAAAVQFSEKVLGKVAGAKSLGSTGVARTSPLGMEIVATISRLLWEHKNGHAKIPDAQRLEEVYPHYQGASTFLLQSLASGMTELGDAYREEGGLVGVLNNAKLMKNLGRLYVADAVLGNGDRLDAMNTGNIAYDGSGSLFAIDSSTVLGSFEQIIKDCTMGGDTWQGYGGLTNPQAGEWAKKMFGKNAMVASPSDKQVGTKVTRGSLAPAARMDLLFEPPKVWESFKKDFTYHLSDENDARKKNPARGPQLPSPSADDWAAGKQPFIDGVLSGLKRVDTMLGGLEWLKTKSKFKSLKKEHGDDPNMDWTNFKLRRMIIREARNGTKATDAKDKAVAYAQRKFPGF